MTAPLAAVPSTSHASRVRFCVTIALIAAGLATGAFLAAGKAGAQTSPSSQTAAASAEASLLDLKPGCWQVSARVSTDVSSTEEQSAARQPTTKLPTVDEQLQQTLARLTPEQRAHIDVDQLRAEIKGMLLAEQRATQAAAKTPEFLRQTLAKGESGMHLTCAPPPFFPQQSEMVGSLAAGCSRTYLSSGKERHTRINCPNSIADYEHPDQEHFSFREQVSSSMNLSLNSDAKPAPAMTTTTYTGKWIGEASPHMPHAVPPTDLNGVRPRGMRAVENLDPFRVVAVVDGKQLTARTALSLFSSVSPLWGDSAKPLPDQDELQQLYMHQVIADEAQRAGLDHKQPFMGQLQGQEVWGLETDPYDFKVNSTDGGSHAEGVRERILWYAYLSQASTAEAKQAFESRIDQRFRLTVIDPDFFSQPERK